MPFGGGQGKAPYGPIETAARRNGWTIRRVGRTIGASKSGRRRQQEWMVCNCDLRPQATLFG